jgi:hypothetical protein
MILVIHPKDKSESVVWASRFIIRAVRRKSILVFFLHLVVCCNLWLVDASPQYTFIFT